VHATGGQVDQVHTAASVCVVQVEQVEQVQFLDEYGVLYLTYRKTAYSVFDVKQSASQGEIKKKWKKKQARKGVESEERQARSKEMIKMAWGILKDPSTRQNYDVFVKTFPTLSTFKRQYPNATSWMNRNAGGEGEAEPLNQDPVPEEAIPEVALEEEEEKEEEENNDTNETPQAFLNRMGFEDVQDDEVEDLLQKLDKLLDRAGWSFWGFWFAWVPVTDTMHPLGFLLYFMSGDLGQAVAVTVVIATLSFLPLVIIPVVETVFILILVMYVYWKQVYDNSETFDPLYVTRARTYYWGLIRCPAGFALIVAALARGPSGQEVAIFYFVAFRFFLAISQFLAHYQSLDQSLLNKATKSPGKRREVRSTNLLLYYDAWLNSFIVCIMTSVVGFFTTNVVIVLLVIDLLCCICECFCNKGRRDDDLEPTCCALSFLVTMLGLTSWGAYEFANDRLDVASKSWDEKDEEGVLRVDSALTEWVQKNFQRLLAKEVARRKKRLERRAEKAKPES